MAAELGRWRVVIDFPAPNVVEGEYMATLACIHLKALLRTHGIDPASVTFHGVRELRSDALSDEGGG